jgi:uncharacterized protein (DUF1501 family)
MMITRRRFVALAASSGGALFIPKIIFAAAETDRRFVFVIQRGAADGLHILAPYAEPEYAKLRGPISSDIGEATKLDSSFALHPALVETAKMYKAGEALFAHAVATAYRDRSHFDGQNVLETGGRTPYELKDGWMNRLTALLPKQKVAPIALAPTMPMALRGSAETTSYAPLALPEPNDDLLTRVGLLYQRDPVLHPLWSAAMETRNMATKDERGQDPAALGKLAATLLARENGPRIAMIETGGWDTHTHQVARLALLLKGFDAMLAAMRDGLGQSWGKTTVLVATEFGRTAAENGSRGTDHGTAAVVMLIGGAVKGGRIIADWPGLSQSALYESRDLKPTMALDALIAGAAGESFSLDPQLVMRAVFKDGSGSKPVTGLIRT